MCRGNVQDTLRKTVGESVERERRECVVHGNVPDTLRKIVGGRQSADLLSKVEGTSRCGNVLSEVWQFRQSCQGIWFDSETSELQNIKGREGGREWRAMCRTIRLGLQQLCAILCGQNWFEALRLCAFLRLSRRSRLFSRLYFNIVTPTMTIARCGACCHGRGLCGLLVGSGARRVFHVKDFASGCF